MNYLFSEYIGVFMDIYDIIIYSDTLEEHVEHVKKILAILKWENFGRAVEALQAVEKPAVSMLRVKQGSLKIGVMNEAARSTAE